MYHIHQLNKISPKGTELFTEDYTNTENANEAEGILVRSANMHEMQFSDNLLAVARAGAGVNNIPLTSCADQGIVVFNTPGANANSVMELAICGKVFKWLKNKGGLAVMKEYNEKKAKVLYDFLDESKLFKGTVEKKDRSLMNVPFVTGDKELDAKFIQEADKAGFKNLKGHRSVGGMRASIYNAMPIEGVEALVEFMKKFEEENQ